MGASIVIDDGGGPVVGSVERDNTYIGTVFTLSNADNTGVLAWEWIIKDKPEGSSATISSATAASPTITPDIPGTYLIQLRTYSDLAATLFDDLDVEGIGIEYGGTETYRIPAAGETNQFDATRGWAAEVNRILVDIRSKLGGGGGGETAKVTAADTTADYLNPKITTGGTFGNITKAVLNPAANETLDIKTTSFPRLYQAMASYQLVSVLGSEVVVGGGFFNALSSIYRYQNIAFEAMGVINSAAANVDILLYDMGNPFAPTAGTLRSTVNLTALAVAAGLSQTLTLDPAPGVDADEIIDNNHFYEIRVKINAANPGDTFRCHWAGISYL